MSRINNLLKSLRTKTHYFMLLDSIYSFLEEMSIPFEEFEKFISNKYVPNDELISKLVKVL